MQEKILDDEPNNEDDLAFQTIIRNRASHGGIMAPGSGLIKNGENGRGISSRWYPKTLAKRIEDIASIRERITFIETDGFEVIDDYRDDSNSVFFIDPPYTAAGKKAGRRLYIHHTLDHKRLFRAFTNTRADFIFTYDNAEELIELAESCNLQTQLIPMKNTHHAKMTELIIGRDLSWLNRI